MKDYISALKGLGDFYKMTFVTFAPETGSFGSRGYQVPIVGPQVEPIESIKPVIKKKKKSKVETLNQKNKKLGRRIQKYSSGTEEYKQSHKSLYTLNKKRLAENNRFLVRNIARQFMGKGLSIDDLVGEGNIGLMEAVKRYDPDYNTAKGEIEFSTYAEYWIKQSIIRGLQGELRGNLPIPYHICANRIRILKLESVLEKELSRKPSEDEIADKFNETYYPDGPKNYHIRGYHIEALKIAVNTPKPIMLRNPDGDEDELIVSSYPNPEEITILKDELEKAKRFYLDLDERDRTILSLYYGLIGNDPKNCSEIGKELGYTRERIRQIHRDTLIKLREKMYPEEEKAA